jgi:tetraacyldisaccharide 4'-kinase
VHVVTRGHGGALEGPVLVEELRHRASDTGDEALLLAAFAKTWVAKDRLAGARAAVEAGADVILARRRVSRTPRSPTICRSSWWMPTVASAMDACFPPDRFGNRWRPGLARADLVLSIGPEAAHGALPSRGASHRRADPARDLKPLPHRPAASGLPVLAFAGIGHPEKFFATCARWGADIRAEHALSDHQPLSDTLMTRMLREAAAIGAQVVTTEKDAVRLSPAFRPRVLTVPVRLEIDGLVARSTEAGRSIDLLPP